MATTFANQIQRTLIVTCGSLANSVGTMVEQKLKARQGPTAAIAIIPASEELSVINEDFFAQVKTALTEISPLNLASLLADDGWTLSSYQRMTLIFILNPFVESDTMIVQLCETLGQLIYQHLGTETTPLLFFIAPDDPRQEIQYCLHRLKQHHVQGIIALSLLTERGFRLADEARLRDLAAEILWAFIATPLQIVPEKEFVTNNHAYDGEIPLASVGLKTCSWLPETILPALEKAWLTAVLKQWLHTAEATITVEKIHNWLSHHHLLPQQLMEDAKKQYPQPAPLYPIINWQHLKPWHIHDTLQAMKTHYTYQRNADTLVSLARPLPKQVEQASQKIGNQLQQILDTSPYSVADAVAWIEQLYRIFNTLYTELLDEIETHAEIDADLSEERGLIEANIKTMMATIPSSNFRQWLIELLQPWRWPHYITQYWRLRQSGLHLNQLLYQQAIRTHQQTVRTAVQYTIADLITVAHQWQHSSEEIQEMLTSLIAEVEKASPPESAAMTKLLAQLLPDIGAEAAAVAACIGGLGSQLMALDDGVLITSLRQLASSRLQQIWQYDVIDFRQHLHPEKSAWVQWWQSLWTESTPLWPYDAASKQEHVRYDINRITTYVTGAGLSKLQHQLSKMKPMTVSEASLDSIQWLESNDRQRLLILRWRQGL